MRSKTWGGGPSMDSNATVGPLPAGAIAKAPLAPPVAPPLAQPPSAQVTANNNAVAPARSAVQLDWSKVIDAFLTIAPAIALKSINV
jgi:hypothetical protein